MQRKAWRKKEAVQVMYTVLTKRPYTSVDFFINDNCKTYLLIFDFHPSSSPVTSAKDFINKTISQRLRSKNMKKAADVPVYAEGTESSGIGWRFPKQEVTGLKITNYIYFLAFQTYYDRRDLVPKGKISVADP